MSAQIWTHWGLNPGPSACEADVIPLHHVPDEHLRPARRCCILFALAARVSSCPRGHQSTGRHVFGSSHGGRPVQAPPHDSSRPQEAQTCPCGCFLPSASHGKAPSAEHRSEITKPRPHCVHMRALVWKNPMGDFMKTLEQFLMEKLTLKGAGGEMLPGRPSGGAGLTSSLRERRGKTI